MLSNNFDSISNSTVWGLVFIVTSQGIRILQFSFEIDSMEIYWKKYVTIYLYLSRFMTFCATVALMVHMCECKYCPRVSPRVYSPKSCMSSTITCLRNESYKTLQCKCFILDLDGLSFNRFMLNRSTKSVEAPTWVNRKMWQTLFDHHAPHFGKTHRIRIINFILKWHSRRQ